ALGLLPELRRARQPAEPELPGESHSAEHHSRYRADDGQRDDGRPRAWSAAAALLRRGVLRRRVRVVERAEIDLVLAEPLRVDELIAARRFAKRRSGAENVRLRRRRVELDPADAREIHFGPRVRAALREPVGIR